MNKTLKQRRASPVLNSTSKNLSRRISPILYSKGGSPFAYEAKVLKPLEVLSSKQLKKKRIMGSTFSLSPHPVVGSGSMSMPMVSKKARHSLVDNLGVLRESHKRDAVAAYIGVLRQKIFEINQENKKLQEKLNDDKEIECECWKTVEDFRRKLDCKLKIHIKNKK